MTEQTPENNIWKSSYSDYEVSEYTIDRILDEKENEDPDSPYFEMDEDEIREDVYQDTDLYTWAWEDFIEDLAIKLEEMCPSGHWYVAASCLGWNHRSGYQWLDLNRLERGETAAQRFIRKCAPDTSDYSVRIEEEDGGLALSFSHHDGTNSMIAYPLPFNPDQLYDAIRSYEALVDTFEAHMAAQLHPESVDETLSDEVNDECMYDLYGLANEVCDSLCVDRVRGEDDYPSSLEVMRRVYALWPSFQQLMEWSGDDEELKLLERDNLYYRTMVCNPNQKEV